MYLYYLINIGISKVSMRMFPLRSGNQQVFFCICDVTCGKKLLAAFFCLSGHPQKISAAHAAAAGSSADGRGISMNLSIGGFNRKNAVVGHYAGSLAPNYPVLVFRLL